MSRLAHCIDRFLPTLYKLTFPTASFKREYPENTLLAFTQARNAGAKVIELDLQLTKDNHIVVSHDPSTARVFNRAIDIHKSTLEEVQSLKTKREPHESLPTFHALLTWLEKPENDGLKLMLDIKRSNRITILDILHQNLLAWDKAGSTSVERITYWSKRLIIGLWNFEFYNYTIEKQYFAGFEKIIISFSVPVVLQLLKFSDKQEPEYRLNGISLLFVSTFDKKLLQNIDSIDKVTADSDIATFLVNYVLTRKINLYMWTVNSEFDINWVINFPFVKGIITDNPDISFHKIEKLIDLQYPGNKDQGDAVSDHAAEDEVNRATYFKLKLHQLRKLFPGIFTRARFRVIMFYNFYRVALKLFEWNLIGVRLFGSYTVGTLLFKTMKAIGFV